MLKNGRGRLPFPPRIYNTNFDDTLTMLLKRCNHFRL